MAFKVPNQEHKGQWKAHFTLYYSQFQISLSRKSPLKEQKLGTDIQYPSLMSENLPFQNIAKRELAAQIQIQLFKENLFHSFPVFVLSYFNSLILCNIRHSKDGILLIRNRDLGSLAVGLSAGLHAW